MTTGDAPETLSVEQVERYLSEVRDVCAGETTFDIHVHATEVIKSKPVYGPMIDGVLSASDDKAYKPPVLTNVRVSTAEEQTAGRMQNRLSEMAFTRAYTHTGPRVVADQLDLAKVNNAVFLPVDNGRQPVAEQMQIIKFCCETDQRFVAGYCVPNDVPDEALAAELTRVREEFSVRLIKVHPNISGLDITTAQGQNRLHRLLRACDDLELPVLIHGGCSPILGDAPARTYSAINNLEAVDWSLTRSPVVIAHFGIYGCQCCASTQTSDAERKLLELLETHEHLYTDTSGVSYAAIERMLSLLEPERVVFGSDAFYVPVFRQLSLVAHALTVLGKGLENIKPMLCDNPKTILGL